MISKLLSKKISTKQASDTGMAAVLVLLLLGFFLKNTNYYNIAIPVLLINMIYPRIFIPLAKIWLSISEILGDIMSKVILSVIYVILVVPVGLFRRLIGLDNLQLRKFKSEKKSVMKDRDYKFSSKDVENPY